jgi:long-chain acyl-CoA synthetase
MNAVDVFKRATKRNGSAIFLRDFNSELTYSEADSRSDAIALGLLERGVTEGAAVGLSARDSVELLVTILAVWKAGAIPSMIDPRTPADALPYFVEDISPAFVIAEPEQIDRLTSAGIDEIAELGSVVGQGELDSLHGPSSPLYLSYTSGSTGAPKGCVIHSQPVALGTACIAHRLGLRHGDLLLATTPASSSFQLVSSILPAMHVGASVGLVAGQGVDRIWDAAGAWGASVLVAYPLTLSDVVNADAANRDHSFRLALSGGSPLPPRLKREYRDHLGIPLVESYGQSEIGGFMALGDPEPDERAFAGFVGRPLPDRLAYVGGADNAELDAGEVGEVLVSEGFFGGYRNKPEETERTLRGGVLHCGDLGVTDGDDFLKVLGRTREADDARRRGAFLRDIEDVLYDHSAVKHAAVVQDADGDTVLAFVELRRDQDASPDELAAFALDRLPNRIEPPVTTILSQMPRTFSGKADRQTLATRPVEADVS